MKDRIMQLVGDIVTITYAGKGQDRSGWDHDAWNVALGDYRTTYKTGLGHRVWAKPHDTRAVLPHGTKPHKYSQYELGSARTLHRERMERDHLKPCVPHPADIIYSLVRDGEAINESFADFCDNYGYNPDSIKDRQLYDQCCEIGQRLRATFPRSVIEEILEMEL